MDSRSLTSAPTDETSAYKAPDSKKLRLWVDCQSQICSQSPSAFHLPGFVGIGSENLPSEKFSRALLLFARMQVGEQGSVGKGLSLSEFASQVLETANRTGFRQGSHSL